MIRIIPLFILGSVFSVIANCQCVGTPGQVSWHCWEEINYYQIEYLYVDDTYPSGPDKIRTLTSLMTPKNYNDHYGALTIGFISVPEDSETTFNITSDDEAVFFLSSDATKDNLDSLISVPAHTRFGEHDKFPEQTSPVVNMVANQLYYFEIHHHEGGGGDHAALFWQRPFESDTTWQIITSPFLTDVCDAVCPPKGASCDDGDPSTTDDVEDGSCNCVGTAESLGANIGARGELDAYFYDDVPGGDIDDLLEDPDFPTMPDRLTIQRNGLDATWTDDYDDFGMMMEGYLTVPTTGCYDFNITGVAEVKFFLSEDEEPTSTSDSIYTRWGVSRLNHDHPDFDGSQTMTDICLEQGRYYYFKVLQVVPSWGYYVNVFWNGPQHVDDGWHHIPEVMLYNYEGELACLPTGYACDDGDPLTASDQIQADCSCAGIPCTPQVDCDDPSANYDPYDYCETSDQLSTRADDGWLSCNPGDNPYVIERSGLHWIHYDLGATYMIGPTRIWNYNVPGETDHGFSEVEVDYSSDGVTWFNLGTYSWPLAPGVSNYQGFDGPDFQNISARYVMFSSLDDVSVCRGISKTTFSINTCSERGSQCDDGDSNTYQDHMNASCECIGYTIEELDCGVDTLYITQEDMTPETYHAISALMSQGNVLDGGDIHYKAGMQIVLEAGFEVAEGGTLDAQIEDCPEDLWRGNEGLKLHAIVDQTKEPSLLQSPRQPTELEVYQLEDRSDQTIHLHLQDPAHVLLDLYDSSGQLVIRLVDHHYSDHGDHYKRIQTSRLDPGIYKLSMKINGEQSFISRFTVQ